MFVTCVDWFTLQLKLLSRLGSLYPRLPLVSVYVSSINVAYAFKLNY